MDFHSMIIPRLNGLEIESNFEHYAGLVDRGVCGFIIFGGELEVLKGGIKKLQLRAKHQLIIASDLEQGLGQHVHGGTIFPPAMAMAKAYENSPDDVKSAYKQIALEARYIGINTIFAPVLDINSNPNNPIIATRAFGEDVETVITMGKVMVEAFKEHGIRSCAKHYPGHGDTAQDSHLELPTIKKSIQEMESCELLPFKELIDAGVDMIMLGHLIVPEWGALPATLSQDAINYLRDTLGFNGIIITDAMDMGALDGMGESEASRLAVEAGVDILLHPSEPDEIAKHLNELKLNQTEMSRLDKFRDELSSDTNEQKPEFSDTLARRLSSLGLRTKEHKSIPLPSAIIAITDDENDDIGKHLSNKLNTKLYVLKNERDMANMDDIDNYLLAVYSSVRAWKGGTGKWIKHAIELLAPRACCIASMGSPYLIDSIQTNTPKLYAYWGHEYAELAVADEILRIKK